MHVVLPLLALVSVAAATPAPQPEVLVLPTPMLGGPPGPGEAVCRDQIHEARDERGLPKLEDKPASAEDPLFIAAVDKRLGGCSVLVMRNDTSDIRPLPAMPEGPPRVQRIPGG